MSTLRFFPWLVAGTVLGLMLWAAPVRADEGLLLSPRQLAPQVRETLTARIAAARAAKPEAFERVAELRASLAELDRRKRGPLAVVAPRLKALGRDGLLPMLERLAVSADGRGALHRSAWLGWRLGLLEAVGSLREPAAEPVLRALLDHAPRSWALRRAAAVAYGKLGTDTAANHLVGLSHRSSPLRKAAIAGLGHCRRKLAAERLAALLARAPSPTEARLLARALGDVGSAWAWQTPIVNRSGQGQAVRTAAATALIEGFVAAGTEVRRMITKAVLVVDHPATLQMIRQRQRGASSAERAALGRLASRVKESPLRR